MSGPAHLIQEICMALHAGACATVLLVDDHRAVREALAQLLEENGLFVCAQVGGRQEALRFTSVIQPDAALVDLSLGEEDGIVLVADLHRLGVAVVVCSSHEEPECVRRALSAGARGYVAKRDAGPALVRTLRDVMGGWVLISPGAAVDLP
jgi:DNA-binding NarL/FixJ family response regulator